MGNCRTGFNWTFKAIECQKENLLIRYASCVGMQLSFPVSALGRHPPNFWHLRMRWFSFLYPISIISLPFLRSLTISLLAIDYFISYMLSIHQNCLGWCQDMEPSFTTSSGSIGFCSWIGARRRLRQVWPIFRAQPIYVSFVFVARMAQFPYFGG